MNSYADEVFKWGVNSPHLLGRRRTKNLNQQTKFGPEHVKTDGSGNVIDMPLLMRKGCFGRPEAHLLSNVYGVRYTRKGNATHPNYSPCRICPVNEACHELVCERIDSCKAIADAYEAFDEAYAKLSATNEVGDTYWTPECWKPWGTLLHAIKTHGNWTNVNDDHVRAANAQQAEDRAAKNRESARRSRAKNKALRKGVMPPGSIAPALLQAIHTGRDERFNILLRLRTKNHAPLWIKKLTQEGCARTADVWQSCTILQQLGRAVIREQGVDVFGFGEQKTPESFRQACRRFIYTENLLPGAPAPDEPDKPDARPSSLTRPASEAAQLIRTAMAQLDDEDGWVALGGVGQRLAVLNSDFDPRTYGFAKLGDLVEKTGAFELDRGRGRGVYIRLKPRRAASRK